MVSLYRRLVGVPQVAVTSVVSDRVLSDNHQAQTWGRLHVDGRLGQTVQTPGQRRPGRVV